MKNKKSLQQSADARLHQASKHAAELVKITAGRKADDLGRSDISNMRDEATHLLQCVHEFSAYWNANETT